MIGYVRALLDEFVFAPQGDEARGDRRALLDLSESPLGTEAQELDTLALRSYPTGSDLSGGVTVRHELTLAVAVTHGDREQAIALRDGIVTDLVLRCRAVGPALMGMAPDSTTGQYVTAITWAVDYRDLGLTDAQETAVLTFTVDTELDG